MVVPMLRIDGIYRREVRHKSRLVEAAIELGEAIEKHNRASTPLIYPLCPAKTEYLLELYKVLEAA